MDEAQKMTGLEKLTALLTEFGIGFSATEKRCGVGTLITCESGGARLEGYGGFEIEFEFDEEGNFQQMAAWE